MAKPFAEDMGLLCSDRGGEGVVQVGGSERGVYDAAVGGQQAAEVILANLQLQAKQAEAVDSDKKVREADALRRALEELKAELLSARRELAEQNMVATTSAAEAATALAAAVTTAERACLERAAAEQARQRAASAVAEAVEGLADLLLALGQWQVDLVAWQQQGHANVIEKKAAGSLQGSATAGQTKEDLPNKIRFQIQAGADRRDDEFLRHHFQSKTTSVFSYEQFGSSLEELGLHLKEEEMQVLFRTLDVNNDGVMDLEEFKKAVRFPSPIEQLLSAFPFSQIFADAMAAVLNEAGIMHPCLREVSQLTQEQIKEMCLAAMPFVRNVIQDEVAKLKSSFEVMDKAEAIRGATKFEVLPEMSSGSVQDFYGGLSGRKEVCGARFTIEIYFEF
jgi:hypothetical protein